MKPTFTILLTLSAGLASIPAHAQTATTAPKTATTTQVDARFGSWLGCWRLEDDLAGTGARMCVTPHEKGVRLQTIVGTVAGLDEVVTADGVSRPIADSSCKGTETAEWSADGMRLFRTTQVTCANESPRDIRSVAFLTPGPALVNVQQNSVSPSSSGVRVQRYRRAFNQNLADGSKAAQPAAGAIAPTTRENAWNIDDVIEANKRLPAEALQAALTESRQKFNMTKTALLQLDDADVADTVIDLMVALTFPQRFVVENPGSGGAPIGVSTGMGWYDPFLSPMLSSSYANCYMMTGYYGYRSYYNMCGYYSLYGPYYGGYYGNYYPYYPGGGNGGEVVPPDTSTGRAVNGRGYTQIRERSSEPPTRVNNGGNGTASGWSGNSGGGVSSGGYSSGSSGSSSGGGGSSSGGGDRTAVARPPGGGN